MSDNGCTNCDADVWTKPYQLESGLLVVVCDKCGHAKVDNTSRDGVELHVREMHRDENGQFTSPGENDA